MAKVSFLVLALYALGNEGIFQGKTDAAHRKSFGTAFRSMKRQSEALADQVLNRSLRGRARLDLISSLEDDAVTPPTVGNSTYNQVKELITSLEEDAVQIQNGNVQRKKSFRKNYEAYGKACQNMRASLGVSNAGQRKRSSYRADMKTGT